MPTCKTCGCTDAALFYPYQTRECKPCTRARVRANRSARTGYYRAYDRERGSRPDRKRQFSEKQRRKRAAAGPDYMRAHNAVARAVASGRLIRPTTCQRCNQAGDIEAHHDDHAKPLDVLWLCPVCHAARHRELGRLRTVARHYDAAFPDSIKTDF